MELLIFGGLLLLAAIDGVWRWLKWLVGTGPWPWEPKFYPSPIVTPPAPRNDHMPLSSRQLQHLLEQ